MPFKVSAQSKGVQTAYRNFIKEYGVKEGRRIFLAKAMQHGTGSTLRERVKSVYSKGSHLSP